MTKRGANLGTTNIRPWDNYLYFFRRTSAIPGSVPSTAQVTRDVVAGMSESTNPGVLVGDTVLYRPSYLVGTGSNTTYIDQNTWEDLAYTSTVPNESTFNCDKYTGLIGDGIPGIDKVRGTSAREVSAITTSYEVTGCSTTSGSTTTINCNTFNGLTQILKAGMSVRGTNIPAGTVIANVVDGSIVVSNQVTAALSNATLYFNEVANLAMFLIQRSW